MTFLGVLLIQHPVDLALLTGEVKGRNFEHAWLAIYPTRWVTLAIGISAAFQSTSSKDLRVLLAAAAIGLTGLSALGLALEVPLACWIAGKPFPFSAD